MSDVNISNFITQIIQTQVKILNELNQLSHQQNQLSNQQNQLSNQQNQFSQKLEEFAKTLGFINEERGRRIIDSHYPVGYSLGLKLSSIFDVELLFRHLNASTNATSMYSERLKNAAALNLQHFFLSIAEKLTVKSIIEASKNNEKNVVEISKVLAMANESELKSFLALTQAIKNDDTRSSSAAQNIFDVSQNQENSENILYTISISKNEQNERTCMIDEEKKMIICTPFTFYILRNITNNFDNKEGKFSLSNTDSMVKNYQQFLNKLNDDSMIKQCASITNKFATATEDNYKQLLEITDNEKIHAILSIDMACNSYISKYELFQKLQYAILAADLFIDGDEKECKTLVEFEHLMCTCDELLMTHKNFKNVCHIIYNQLFPHGVKNKDTLSQFIDENYKEFNRIRTSHSVSLRQIYSEFEPEIHNFLHGLTEFYPLIHQLKSVTSHCGKIRCQTLINISDSLQHFKKSGSSALMDIMLLNDYIFDFPRHSLELDARGGIKILTALSNKIYETAVYATTFEIKTNLSANEQLGDRAAFMGLVSLIACEPQIKLKSIIIECVAISNKQDAQLNPDSDALNHFLKIAAARDIKVTIVAKTYTL